MDGGFSGFFTGVPYSGGGRIHDHGLRGQKEALGGSTEILGRKVIGRSRSPRLGGDFYWEEDV
jgi:hypothetical protein